MSYGVRLVSLEAKQEPAHLRLHPFGLIPTYEDGDLAPVRDRRDSGLLDEFPTLAAYVARGDARPAYERAFAAQR